MNDYKYKRKCVRCLKQYETDYKSGNLCHKCNRDWWKITNKLDQLNKKN